LRGASRRYFIATTVDLLSTGVDVPCVRNIVFFKYLKSPISFYQMVGRGTRIDLPTGKLMFRVYDYTDATRLFGEDFTVKPPRVRAYRHTPLPLPPEPTVQVDGFDVHVTPAGRYIVADVDGVAVPIPVEEYRARLAARLVERARTLDEFRALWIEPPNRHELLVDLLSAGVSPNVVRMVDEKESYDLYDVLAELGWGMRPLTRGDRVAAFGYKHEDWLKALPPQAGATLSAIAGLFERGGTEALEKSEIVRVPKVVAAGGFEALRRAGVPRELVQEAKVRMFAA
jgi:type I restriction enzyme R subunit